MNSKAISNKKRDVYLKKAVLALAISLICIFLFLIGVNVYKTIVFNKSLPDPSLATEMSIYHAPSGSVIFHCNEMSIVSLGKNAKFSDYLLQAGGHVNVLFLTDTTETTFDNLTDAYVYGSIDTIYVPKGADKEYMERLKKKHGEETKIVRLKKKGERFVLGEMVVRVFSVSDDSIAFSLTHGYDNFLVAQQPHNLKELKNTSIKAAFAPIEALEGLKKVDSLLCKVPKDSPEPTKEDFSYVCKQYCVSGSRLIYAVHMKDSLDFDASFTQTGKLD